MIDTYDVKENMRPSDKILYLLNWLEEAKNKGIPLKDTLANIIECVGDVFANLVKRGKADEELAESFESYLTQFIGKNKDKYLSHEHDDLDRSTKRVLEGLDIAKAELEQKHEFVQPTTDVEGHTLGFRRLG